MEWWQRIWNTPLYFELYEQQDTELAKSQVGQLVALLNLTPPAGILDVGCGYGRHSIELAGRGFTTADRMGSTLLTALTGIRQD